MHMIRKTNPTILLNKAFPYGMTTGGIFVLLTNPPWAEQNITPSLLDMDYFGNHSGEKPISPLVHKLLDSDDTVGLEARTQLAALVMAKFYQPWKKLYDTYYVNYDPLVNYDMDGERAFLTWRKKFLQKKYLIKLACQKSCFPRQCKREVSSGNYPMI